MIVCTAFSQTPALDGDQKAVPLSNAQLANKWFDRCAELGGVEDTELVVIGPPGYGLPETSKAWGKVTFIQDREQVKGWPRGPNSLFRQLAWFIYYRSEKTKNAEPWLFCEPDCVPLRDGWLPEISLAYDRANKPFMGVKVSAQANPKGGAPTPEHMTGNGVYPARAVQLAPALVDERKMNVAWDVRSAHQVVPQMATTDLIAHFYRHPRILTLDGLRAIVPARAVLFHSDKYGAIADLLARTGVRAAESGEIETAVQGQGETLNNLEKHRPEIATREDIPVPPVFSHTQLCEVISANVKSETARLKLMTYLHSKHFHQKNFGAAIKELASAK